VLAACLLGNLAGASVSTILDDTSLNPKVIQTTLVQKYQQQNFEAQYTFPLGYNLFAS
jgi:hypothetical protein